MKNKAIEILTFATTGFAPFTFSSKTDNSITGKILRWNQSQEKIIIRLGKMITSNELNLDVLLPKHLARFRLIIEESFGNNTDHVCKISELKIAEKAESVLVKEGTTLALPSKVNVEDNEGEITQLLAAFDVIIMEKGRVVVGDDLGGFPDKDLLIGKEFPINFEGNEVGYVTIKSANQSNQTRLELKGSVSHTNHKSFTYSQEELAKAVVKKADELILGDTIIL